MARTKVTLNHSEAAKILKGTGAYVRIRVDLTERGQRVLTAAKAAAPVKTGNYRDGLVLVQDTTDRAVVRVVGTAPHTHLVEADTGNLARALDAAK